VTQRECTGCSVDKLSELGDNKRALTLRALSICPYHVTQINADINCQCINSEKRLHTA